MDSFSPLCPTCAKSLLTDDDDPTLVEAANHLGQPVLLKIQKKTRIDQITADNEKWAYHGSLWWQKFLAGIKHPTNLMPDSCGFCEYILQLMASDVVLHAVRDQEKKTGHRFDRVSVCVRRLWAGTDFPFPARFSGINLAFNFGRVQSTEYEYPFNQHFFLVPHASNDYPEVANWLQCQGPVRRGYTEAKYVNWMRDQLAACQKDSCGEENRNANKFIPQRLLDVTAGQVKLISRTRSSISSSSSSDDQHPRYAALSYCWGDPSMASTQMTTTNETEVAHQAGIPMEDLTQTQREAVAVCRSLDIPYLWVDALCILQNDDDDWNRQCVDMCNIYSNAHVTLCASSSRSCSETFTERKGQLFEVPFVSRRYANVSGKYILRAVHTRFRPHSDESSEWDRRGSEWASRGWVLQEHVSATRSITFGDISLHFECPHTATEFETTSPCEPTFNFPPSALRQQNTISDPADVDDLLFNWTWLVSSHAYKGRFTRPGDFLPSLSGLASSIKKACPTVGDYIAGLWTNTLHLHLCQFEPSYMAMHRVPMRAHFFAAMESNDPSVPSWSPLNGLATHPPHDVHNFRSKGLLVFSQHRTEAVIEAEVDHVNTLNPFGAIKSALLMVQSLVLDLRHPNLDKLQLCYLFDPHSKRHSHDVHAHTHLRNGCHRICKVAFDFQWPRAAWRDEEFNERFGPVDASMDLPSMRLLLLGTCKVARSSDGRLRKGRGAYGLILWPSPTNSQRWRRIGVFFPTAARGSYREGFRLIKRLGVMDDTIVE